MKSLVLSHLAAIFLAALALWSMRHELTEQATKRRDWALPAVFAVMAASELLIVSPGKQFALWTVAIGLGFAIGLVAGMALTAVKDFTSKLVLIHRTWDGVGAATLLLLLTLVRFVTTDLMGRESHGFGILGAMAAFLSFFLVGRVVTLQFYTAPRSIHLDMVPGERRRGD
jgi:uncharacterized membrane protein